MRQVIQRRKRCAVRKFRRGLHHAGFTVGAAVGDLKHAARLATELTRHRFQVGTINHQEAWASASRRPDRRPGLHGGGRGRRGGGWQVRRIGDGVPQRGVPRVGAGRFRRIGSRLRGHRRRRRQLDLERDVPWLHKAEPLAGLRRDIGRVSELVLALLELGDLPAQRGFGRSQLIHLGSLREVGAHRARRWSASARRSTWPVPRPAAR